MAAKLKVVQEEGLNTLCDAIRGSTDTATQAATAVIALADATNASLGEVEQILNDLSPNYIVASLPATGWIDNTDAASKAAGYTKMWTLAVEDATADDGADVIVAPSSEDTAITCGLCPSVDVVEGGIIFYAVVAPTAAITIQYDLEKG